MAHWTKHYLRDVEDRPFIKVTNGPRSFRCENEGDAQWLLRLLRDYAENPQTPIGIGRPEGE